MKLSLAVALVCFASLSVATRVRKCGKQKSSPVEDENISITSCEKLPCRLKKATSTEIEVKFSPKKDVAKLQNSVNAQVLGLPVPFIGVDGYSVCKKLYDTKGAKAGCPLKAGQEYVYKDSFPVLELYPTLQTWVHWALVDERGENNVCFEVPVKITN